MTGRLALAAGLLVAGLFVLGAGPAAGKDFDTPVETTYRQLTWDDFKSGDSTGGRWERGAWAHVAAGLRYDAFRAATRGEGEDTWLATPPPEIEVYAVMDKFLSGVARGAEKDEVLAHEQLHFDVTEAFARRLNARILGLEGRGEHAASAERDLDVQIQQAYAEAVAGMQAYQQRYDGETAHGTKKKLQKRWRQQIGELFAAATAELEAARAP